MGQYILVAENQDGKEIVLGRDGEWQDIDGGPVAIFETGPGLARTLRAWIDAGARPVSGRVSN